MVGGNGVAGLKASHTAMFLIAWSSSLLDRQHPVVTSLVAPKPATLNPELPLSLRLCPHSRTNHLE